MPPKKKQAPKPQPKKDPKPKKSKSAKTQKGGSPSVNIVNGQTTYQLNDVKQDSSSIGFPG